MSDSVTYDTQNFSGIVARGRGGGVGSYQTGRAGQGAILWG
jgi:hypothetical protein